MNEHLPFLLLCEHFFCKSCIESYFTDENGIISCPEDGQVANSINELKILKNLIIGDSKQKNNNVDNSIDEISNTKTYVNLLINEGELLWSS